VVSLPGEVSYYSAQLVREELTAALEPGVTIVILDLTLTTFFDSAGLGEIETARRLAAAYRIDLRVIVPGSSPLAGFFASSGLDQVLMIYPTLRAALTGPRAPGADTRPALSPSVRRARGPGGTGWVCAGEAWACGGVAWTRSN
jgi:anti-anti-sigma factor